MAEDFAIGRALVIPQSVMNNLNKIDEKINLIASDSEKMATHFTSAMARMDTSTGDLIQKLQSIHGLVGSIGNINIKGLDTASTSMSKTATEAEKVANNITQAATSINKMGSGMNIAELTAKIKELNDQLTKGGGVQTVAEQQSIVNQKRALEEELKLQKQSDNEKQKIRERSLEQELKRSDRELSAIKKLEDERIKSAQREYQAQAKIDSQLRKLNYQSYVTSTEGSLRTADKANTYAQRAQAIKNLEEAIKRLRTTDANYQKDLQRLSDAHKRLSNEQKKVEANFKSIQSSQSRLMDTSGQLARQLALVFSVSQIEGYIMKLVRVRGEFELQNTALASILQNKDQADKLFGQITELAVKSPFTVKELTTYTKSLSAYSVEYEKLYDTTKMLADVSAGLGVDMQRLILAFGQVKAANFLRGTETRQFTEAGINMLGELAKYYTELEGRIVSVSEVQDRQFKKMISFQDVEQVFKRLTSAGGMFYEMQERQAETIAGQMSNLQDTIDIMLNDIGKANDGTIRLMISTIKSIIENWEIFANAIKTAGVAFTLYYAKVMLASAANGAFAKSTIAATVAQGGLVGATGKVINAVKSLATVVKSNPFLAIASAVTLAGYELYDHARKVEENKKAYDVFTNSVKQTQTEFGNITSRVSEQNQKIKETLEKVSSLKKGTKEYSEAENEANKQREKMSALLEELNSKFPDVYESIIKQKDGTVDLTEAQALLNEQLERTTYLSYLSRQTETFWNDGLVENIKDASEAQQKYKLSSDDLSNAYTQMTSRIKEYFATNKYASKDLQKQLDEIANSSLSTADKIEKMYSVVRNVSGVNIGDLRRIIYDYQDDAQKSIKANKELEESNSNLSKSIEQVANGYKLAFDTSSEEGRAAAKAATEEFMRLLDIKNEAVRKFVQTQFEVTIGVKLDIDDKKTPELSKMEKRINNYLKDMDFTLIPKIDAGEGTVKFFNKLKEEYQSLSEEAEKIKRATQELYPDKTNVQRLEEINKKMIQVKTTLKDWGELEEKQRKKKGDDKELQLLKDRIALLKRAGQEYEKLRKYYSEEEATQIVRKSFGDAFDNLGLSIDMTFDTSGVIEGIESISHKAGQEGKKAVDEAVASLKAQQDIDVRVKGLSEIQKQLDDVFAGYELSVELEKMGLDNNLISQLFDVDTFSLDDVQKNLDKLKPKLIEYGEEGVKVFSDMEKKITEMQQKELEERLKKYASYLEKSVDKISNIKVKAGVDIQYAGSLFSEGKIDANQYANILKEIIAEMNEEIGKINVNKFKESSEYIKAMGDLSLYSKNELAKLAQQIQNLISESSGKMNASDLKVYQDALDKINDRIREIDSPFKNNPISEFKELVRIQKEFNEEKKRYNELLKRRNELEIQLEQAKLELERLKKMQEENPTQDFSSNISNTQNNIKDIVNQIGSMNNQLNTSQGAMSNLSSQAGGMMDNQQMAMAKIDKIIKSVYNTINSIVEQFEELKELAETFGAETDEGVWDRLSKSFSAISEMNENVMSSWESYKSGDYVGASVKAVSAIFSVVKGINRIIDSKKEDIIRRQMELVENLQEAYEKLKEDIDNAFSIDTLEESNRLAQENIEQTIAHYEQMIAAEKDKKNTDDDRVKEWEDTIEDLREEQEKLKEDYITSLGGFGSEADIKSAAQQFADAWYEAFKETGDGLIGLEENFDELLDNILKKQIMLKATDAFLKPLFEQINAIFSSADFGSYIESIINGTTSSFDGANITLEELQAVQDLANKVFPEMNEYLKDLMESLGVEWGTESKDTMSGLQKGIQGVTEETAQALEALLNSMRYFVSDSNTVLHNIYTAIAMPNVENPFLTELKVQSNYLNNLNALVSSVIKNSSGKGKVLRVEIA